MDDLRLTLGAALAADRLEDFVRQQEAHGVELDIGSDFERALALLLVQRGLSQERHQVRCWSSALGCRVSVTTLRPPPRRQQVGPR
jgi:hypothetical protein